MACRNCILGQSHAVCIQNKYNKNLQAEIGADFHDAFQKQIEEKLMEQKNQCTQHSRVN